MKLIKFRTYNHASKDFSYSGGGGDLQQFIGILDKNLKQIFERDVIQFDKHEGTAVGVVQYYPDYCSYALDSDIGVVPFVHIDLQSLEVVGNMDQDYVWDETGSKLIKKLPCPES